MSADLRTTESSRQELTPTDNLEIYMIKGSRKHPQAQADKIRDARPPSSRGEATRFVSLTQAEGPGSFLSLPRHHMLRRTSDRPWPSATLDQGFYVYLESCAKMDPRAHFRQKLEARRALAELCLWGPREAPPSPDKSDLIDLLDSSCSE